MNAFIGGKGIQTVILSFLFPDVSNTPHAVVNYRDGLFDHISRMQFGKDFDDCGDNEKIQTREKAEETVYNHLDSLDVKASGLISAISIIFGVQLFTNPQYLNQIPHNLYIYSVGFSFFSLFLMVLIYGVYWPTIKQFTDPTSKSVLDRTIETRNFRTQCLRLSRWVFGIAVLLFGSSFIIDTTIEALRELPTN